MLGQKMRGFRYSSISVSLAAVVLFLIFVLISGCAGEKGSPVKTVEHREITETTDIYQDEPYTVQETRVVGENCIERHYSELNDSRFNISIGDPEWLGDKIFGETDYVRRIVQIYNARDEVDTIYLDKIYLYDGLETKRAKHPMMFLIDPKSTRTLYVMWDTQYDPKKDVSIDISNNTAELGFETHVMRICYDETETVNVTKYRKVKTGEQEQVVEYQEYTRVKLPSN